MSIEVGVGGVGMHPFGRFDDAGLVDLGVTAVRQAMAEAGIGPGGFQAAYCGTAYGGVATGHRVLGALALTGTPIIDVEAGCASGGAALQLGGQAIASGRHDTVLVFGVEKMPKGIIRSSFFDPWQEQAGLSPAPAYFALRAQRLMADSGRDQGRSGRRLREEPGPRGRQPHGHVAGGGDRGGRAGQPGRLRAAAPLDALLAQRGRRSRRPAPRPDRATSGCEP